MPDPVEGEVVVNETPPLKAPLVAADSNTDNVERVDDAGNRAVRTGGITGVTSVIAWALQKFTQLDAEDVIFLAPFIASALSYAVNVAEYNGWIPRMKPDSATLSPPRTTEGQLLGQSKT